MTKKPILPQLVHVVIRTFSGWDCYDEAEYTVTRHIVPSRWLRFNGQTKYTEWSWNKNYEKAIKDKIGEAYGGDIHVVEWSLIENVTYILKSAKELGFDVLAYIKSPITEIK